MQPFLNYFKHPSIFFDSLVVHFGQMFPDSTYIKLRYRFLMGNSLNLKNPRSFQEKLQWLKLHDRNPEYTRMVDKAAVKEYVANLIGEEYIIPTIGVWNKPEEIEWDILPTQFVLKTTHGGGGGGIVICRNINEFDKKAATKRLNMSLFTDIYRTYREWPYKNVPKRCMAEKLIECNEGELKDYKFFCFNGQVKFFKIDFNRFEGHRANYYDREGKLLPFGEECCLPDYDKKLVIPSNLEKMIEIAEIISKDKTFVRIDLYNCDGKILFGEITFFPAGGMGKFIPEEWGYKIGEMLDLPEIHSCKQ